jgi:ribose transport system ATP-binding protein
MSTDPGPVPSTVLSLQGVSKRFGAVQALRGASIECRAGEIHAVVGENGSGKSTLLGIASGVLQPDEGTVEINGRRLHTGDAVDAIRLGVSTAYQAYSHVLELTVAENLFLATPPAERPSFRRTTSWASETLRRFDLRVSPGARVRDLNLADRQLLEVVKSLLSNPTVLLLDEPTTALGPGEVERLHGLVIEKAR